MQTSEPRHPELQALVPHVRYLAYAERLDVRPTDTIDTVVIHCTELPDLEMARQYGEKIMHADSNTGNSGHFYIDRDGSIEQWVPLERAAHHVKDHNSTTMGIELVNLGRYPHWLHSEHQIMSEKYPPAQITALTTLLEALATALPSLRWICGHEELDTTMLEASDDPAVQVQRKLDPGILFPWAEVMQTIALKRLSTPENANTI